MDRIVERILEEFRERKKEVGRFPRERNRWEKNEILEKWNGIYSFT